jgi:hypothetical protein
MIFDPTRLVDPIGRPHPDHIRIPNDGQDTTMPELKTLLELAGADLKPATVGNATLVLIDYQNEYVAGPLGLPGAASAMASPR